MARLNQRTALEAGNHHRGRHPPGHAELGMGTHLRLIVILTVILFDHIISRHLVWIGYLERVLTSTMVDPAYRIQHLINELFITYDPHRIATFGVGSGWREMTP
nr:hypothetical protein [Pseudomonas savastanoi]